MAPKSDPEVEALRAELEKVIAKCVVSIWNHFFAPFIVPLPDVFVSLMSLRRIKK